MNKYDKLMSKGQWSNKTKTKQHLTCVWQQCGPSTIFDEHWLI